MGSDLHHRPQADERAEAIALLEIAEGKRQVFDQMMWQVPGLSLTAQAFLLSIAFSGSAPRAGAIMAGVLGLVASLATIQLLLKQRFNEVQTSEWMRHFAESKSIEMPGDRRRAWPAEDHLHEWELSTPPSRESSSVLERAWRALNHRIRRFMVSKRSPTVWVATLAIFGLVDLFAAVLAALGSG